MSRFYGHHMDCPIESKYGECEYMHDHRIRAAHDLYLLNEEKKEED